MVKNIRKVLKSQKIVEKMKYYKKLNLQAQSRIPT